MSCVDFPFGIPPFPDVTGDTIIVNLCSLPCAFQVSVDTGTCMICVAPGITLAESHVGEASAMRIIPNPIGSMVRRVVVDGAIGTYGSLRLLDSCGRCFAKQGLVRLPAILHLPPLAPGTYLLELSGGNTHVIQRLLVE